MKLTQATLADFDSVLAFYGDVMDRTPEIARYARWQKGKHPTPEGIKAFIEEGNLYLRREKGVIIGAMAFPMHQGEEYHAIAWPMSRKSWQTEASASLPFRPSTRITS